MYLFLPQTIEEAIGLLVQHEGARCISGGATLVAMMNAGLVEPTALVSLRQIPGLSGILREGDGRVRIGVRGDPAGPQCDHAETRGVRTALEPPEQPEVSGSPGRN